MCPSNHFSKSLRDQNDHKEHDFLIVDSGFFKTLVKDIKTVICLKKSCPGSLTISCYIPCAPNFCGWPCSNVIKSVGKRENHFCIRDYRFFENDCPSEYNIFSIFIYLFKKIYIFRGIHVYGRSSFFKNLFFVSQRQHKKNFTNV